MKKKVFHHFSSFFARCGCRFNVCDIAIIIIPICEPKRSYFAPRHYSANQLTHNSSTKFSKEVLVPS